ncbi:MAG: LysM peptidoglycan-binding domain-containing protein, partial [Acidobacteriota bacterium]|nr:LysM peptidoglycan-binding domain-containing protein [Acidobacteriota bacterium]
LAGRREFPYTEEQEDYVEDVRERWEQRLEDLEKKIEDGDSLTRDDKALALLITAAAGTDGVRDSHERVRTQRGLRERFARGIEISGRYMDRFREIFREEGLPEDLAFLPHVESSFQVDAHSSAGAVGVWQFTRGTGRQYMTISSTVDERRDPVMATRGAAAYFRDAYDVLGNWALSLTSYNHGLHGMRRAQEKYGDDFVRIVREYRSRTFGFASRNFYTEFLAARKIAREPALYFPEGLTAEPPLRLDSVVLERRRSPSRLAKDYNMPVAELAALNPAWTGRAVERGHALPVGLTVWLPEGIAAPTGATGVHVVERGDTLSTIASRYGVSVDDLRRVNGIPAGESVIHVGQELRLGPGTRDEDEVHVHEVRRGENLSTIAQRYGMTVSELRKLNGISAGDDVIHVGQTLRVDWSGAPDTIVHVVRRGDSLIRIAAEYGVRLSAVLVENQLTTSSIIYPGQQILVPLVD